MRGFTLIELLIVIAIISIIGLMVVHPPPSSPFQTGRQVIINQTGIRGLIVNSSRGSILSVRIDNGPGSVPRYSVVDFMKTELSPDVGVER